MFIGSCFASSIGSQMESGRMPVMINPAGAVYNPVSVSQTLKIILSGKELASEDLYCHNGTWLSFCHYTDFSGSDPIKVLEKINTKSKEAFSFLQNARFLFVTLGTARVYKWKETGQVVSNCHKIPSSHFESVLLSVEEIVTLWTNQLDILQSTFPGLKVVFTISPVRHWKDGAHGNQVSKAVLLLAVEELLKHPVAPFYFPAYEIVMDDLRDYRYYDDDMLHPSQKAINYIWDAFAGCYLDNKTICRWKEVVKITKALGHRFNTDSASGKKDFALRMLAQISDIEADIKNIDLLSEKDYFQNLLKL